MDAESLLRSAAEQQPENLLAQQYIALCELMQGNVEEAATRIERIGLAANADFLALFSCEIERRLTPPEHVVDKETPPPSPPIAAAIARLEERAARKSGFFFGRMAWCRVVGKLELLGENAYDHDDFAGALAAFEAALRCRPDAPTALLGVGLSALRLDRPSQAAQSLAEAFRRRPDDGVIASSYGDALCRTGRFAEALAVFEEITPAGPEDFHAHYGRGACLTALGRKPDALEQFRVAFERYRLDAVDDCLIPSWEELLKRESEKNDKAAETGVGEKSPVS
jgi:tetratricopeptide (TPR) repeat protein